MTLEKQNLDKKTKLAKKVNPVKKSDDSDIQWWMKEVVVPIAIAVIPALISSATPLITPPNTQQPPNPPIDRTIPPSK